VWAVKNAHRHKLVAIHIGGVSLLILVQKAAAAQFVNSSYGVSASHSESHWKDGKFEHENGLKSW